MNKQRRWDMQVKRIKKHEIDIASNEWLYVRWRRKNFNAFALMGYV